MHGIAALANADLLDGASRERAAEGAIDVAWRGIADPDQMPLRTSNRSKSAVRVGPGTSEKVMPSIPE